MQALLDSYGLDWSWEVLVLFLVLALIAEVLGTVGGFGSSVFFVPIATTFMGFHEALGLTALFHVSSNISKIALFRKGIDKRIILLLGVPAVIAVSLGAWVTRFIETEQLEFFLGILLITLSLMFLLYPKLKISPSPINAITGGVLSGGIAGLLGTGGAIRGLTLAAFGMSKEVFVATSAIIDLGVDASRSIVYSTNGFVSVETLKILPFLILIGFGGTLIGRSILKKVPQKRFEKIVLILVLLTGSSMIVFGN